MFSYPQPENIHTAYSEVRETLPRSTLGYKTNNVYRNFPPILEDGRSLIASYQPEAVMNSIILQQNHITSNWQYRRYLTDHAVEIMQQNFRESCNDVGYVERAEPSQQKFSTPHRFQSIDEEARVIPSASDLKTMYLSREQLDQRKQATTLTQEQLFQMNVRK